MFNILIVGKEGISETMMRFDVDYFPDSFAGDSDW
jgi:hypothetical protein